jgi:hypothetical protein
MMGALGPEMGRARFCPVLAHRIEEAEHLRMLAWVEFVARSVTDVEELPITM